MDQTLYRLGSSIDPSLQHVLKSCAAGRCVIWNDHAGHLYCSHTHELSALVTWLQKKKNRISQQLCPTCEVVATQTENIARLTLENTDYRRVISDTDTMQLVLMSLASGEEIGEETHSQSTQFVRVESGVAGVTKNGTTYSVPADHYIIIEPDVRHNVWNMSSVGRQLKLYTIYCPPVHARGTVQRTKNVACANEDRR